MNATEPTRAPADVAHASTGRIAGQAALSAVEVLVGLGSEMGGLSRVEAAARLVTVGPNAVRTHKAQAWVVLGFWNEFRAERAAEAEVDFQLTGIFFSRTAQRPAATAPSRGRVHHITRRAARFSAAVPSSRLAHLVGRPHRRRDSPLPVSSPS